MTDNLFPPRTVYRIPAVQVGKGNQIKVVEPALATYLDHNDSPAAVSTQKGLPVSLSPGGNGIRILSPGEYEYIDPSLESSVSPEISPSPDVSPSPDFSILSAPFRMIEALNDDVTITSAESSIHEYNDELSGIVLKEGKVLYGNFTKINFSGGKLIGYP